MLSVSVSVRLSYVRPSIFSFLDDNLSKCQCIFTKLGLCIDIVEIWFGGVNEQISSIFDSYLRATDLYFHFRMITLVNINGFTPNLACALILWRSCLGLLMSTFHLFWQSYQPLKCLYLHFWPITFQVNINGFSPHLASALMQWTFALGLLKILHFPLFPKIKILIFYVACSPKLPLFPCFLQF